MISDYPYGNDPVKLDRYRAFWAREKTDRPLIGFSQVGWFPLEEFSACQAWEGQEQVTPEVIDPEAFLEDHVRMVREGERIDDDLIRGAGPTQVAIPFMPGIVGCRIRLLPQNVMGEERRLGWDQILPLRLDRTNPWYLKYMAFVDALVRRAAGEFPVSHGAEIGPTDVHAALRGHTDSIADLIDDPEKTAQILHEAGILFRELTEDVWKRVPLFHGGYYDGQYSLWAPGPIARLQEDASAVYSPRLYRELVQPVDRILASHFECAFMHLHSTSMFLLDAILEIEELRCFEINNDVVGPPIPEMIKFFKRVQEQDRSLLIRGSFEPAELKALLDSLDPRGLFLLIMVRNVEEIGILNKTIGL